MSSASCFRVCRKQWNLRISMSQEDCSKYAKKDNCSLCRSVRMTLTWDECLPARTFVCMHGSILSPVVLCVHMSRRDTVFLILTVHFCISLFVALSLHTHIHTLKHTNATQPDTHSNGNWHHAKFKVRITRGARDTDTPVFWYCSFIIRLIHLVIASHPGDIGNTYLMCVSHWRLSDVCINEEIDVGRHNICEIMDCCYKSLEILGEKSFFLCTSLLMFIKTCLVRRYANAQTGTSKTVWYPYEIYNYLNHEIGPSL